MSKLFETTDEFKEAYRAMIMAEVGKDIASAHGAEQYRALAKLIATRANRQFAECDSENGRSDRKKVYYFSLEFLMGPLLDNYLLNYGVRDIVEQGLAEMGIELDDLLAEEGDPGQIGRAHV